MTAEQTDKLIQRIQGRINDAGWALREGKDKAARAFLDMAIIQIQAEMKALPEY